MDPITESVAASQSPVTPEPPAQRRMVPVVSSRGVEQVFDDEVDYRIPHGRYQFTAASNTLPMPQSMKGARFTISAKYATQALPMKDPEAPLVDTLDEDAGEGVNTVLGKRLGMIASQYGGVVTNISPTGIDLKTPEGKKTIELHDYFPGARKTHTTDKPLVKIGDTVSLGQHVARSNYVTDDGTLALGKNLKVAFMAGPNGGTFEDSITLSQGAANKMTSSHLYGYDADTSDGTILSKSKFVSLFPNKYTKAQLEKFGPDGLPLKGSVLESGDPVFLGVAKRAMTSKDAAMGNIGKILRNSWTDRSQVWTKHTPGTVADSQMNRGGGLVNIATEMPLRQGDKLCLSPDHEVLATRGWVPISQVVVGDQVYSINPTTGRVSISVVSETHEFDHEGKMHSLETTQVSSLATLDHTIPAKRRKDKGFGLHKFRDIIGQRYSMMRSGLSTQPAGPSMTEIESVEVELGGNGVGKGRGQSQSFRLSTEAYLFLVGAYVSEGNLRDDPSRGNYGIEICQCKTPNKARLLALLAEAGVDFCDNGDKCVITGIAWLRHFEKFGRGAINKTILPVLGSFSANQLRFLLDGLMWGDGSVAPNGSMAYHTISPQLAGDMQHLALLVEMSANVKILPPCDGGMIDGRQIVGKHPRHWVSIYRSKNNPTINHGHAKDQGGQREQVVDYGGKVHCLTVPGDHTFYVRRNGKCHFTGNSARQGAKGVVGLIVPDHLMPHGEDGKPLDIFINTAALIGRVNPAMVFESMLGKIALKTGKRVIVPQFTKESSRDMVERLLNEHGLKPTETVTNPVTGRSIDNILTGHQYFLKLEHTSESKISGRAEGGVDINDQPSKNDQSADSSKRLGGLMNTALASAGATEVLRDAKVYRGTGNQELWRRIRAGQPLPAPQVPFIYNKYLNSLRAAGINVKERRDSVSISAMTDKEVDNLKPVEVNDPSTINPDTGEPIKGGLFDYSMFGGTDQKGWGVIKLDDPIPNPLMEESVRAILGLTEDGMREVIAGRRQLNGQSGPGALKSALEKTDLKSMERDLIDRVRNGTRSGRDAAIKSLSAVRGLVKAGMDPVDMLVTKVPVIPPTYRPATIMDGVMLVSDANYLYKDLLEARNSHRVNKEDLPEEELGDEKLAIYDSLKAIQGFGDPIHPEHRAKGVKGFVRQITGSSGPKSGLFQSKVLGHPVNTVGRSVIIPDSRLDMDHVGLPEKMAWRMYSPFVIGRMVKDGMKSQTAATETERKSKTAKRYLLDEMSERPILYSRDPALHRFAIMGAKPVLVPGDSLRISPLVVGPFTADFDGDAMNVHVPISREAVSEVYGKMLPSQNLYSIRDRKVHYKPSQEFILGLYNITSSRGGEPVKFASLAQARAAYDRGDIAIDTPVEIGEGDAASLLK